MTHKNDHIALTIDVESTEFLQSLIDRSESIISYFTPIFEQEQLVDFKLVYITNNFEKYIKSSIDLLINKSASEIFPVIFENGLFEIYTACYNKENFEITYEREFEFEEKTVWLEGKVIKQNNGIIVTSKDISKLKKVEAQLRDSLRHLEFQNTILNDSEQISKTASFRWNINKNIWVFSENIRELFKDTIDAKCLQNEGVFCFLDEQKSAKLRLQIETLQYEDVLPPFEFSIQNDNTLLYFSLNAHFIPSRDGQMMLGVIRNVTEEIKSKKLLKEKNQELLTINEELDSFNHIASHDLQEPLRKIRMFISRILNVDQETIPDKILNYLDKINDSSERMQQLILHLLDYSSIGKKQLPFEKIDLNTILQDAFIELEEEINKHQVQIHTINFPEIYGIPFLIKQVFVNLISNAIKYRKTNAIPELWIHHNLSENLENSSSHFLEITFKDNGIGFDPKHKESIFKLFHRLHEKTQYKGTGIGLAICHKIMQTHHGSISAMSEKGVGSEFKLYFPITNN
ncbi:hypothetical protein GCM10009430_09950 [Aquimarina litoralis]|uniref:histidine kinase n=1 Tax=Aquimarina litoralis TaxID=584605 RepID=A0ABN1IJK4_9FLAO